jgi:hypothetical protein
MIPCFTAVISPGDGYSDDRYAKCAERIKKCPAEPGIVDFFPLLLGRYQGRVLLVVFPAFHHAVLVGSMILLLLGSFASLLALHKRGVHGHVVISLGGIRGTGKQRERQQTRNGQGKTGFD